MLQSCAMGWKFYFVIIDPIGCMLCMKCDVQKREDVVFASVIYE